MKELYVVDTNAIIATFPDVFHRTHNYSPNIIRKIKSAIFDDFSRIRISIPSVVFLELHDKFCKSEEITSKIFYEVFFPIKDSNFIEIRSLDKELIEIVLQLDGVLTNHDMHDKIIYSTAVILNCCLISSDSVLKENNLKTKMIPNIIS